MTIFRRVTGNAARSADHTGQGGDGPRHSQIHSPGRGHPAAGADTASGDHVTARFTATDAMVLRDLAGQLAELVGGVGGDAGGRGHGARQAAGDQGLGGQGGVPTGWAGPGGTAADGPPASMADDLAELLGLTQDATPPDDPALARLLPDAYPDDPAASAEFRRYTERDLRTEKVAAARTVLDTLPARGGRVRLSYPQAQVWLRALNDIRLALGVRLGIAEESDAEFDRMNPEDPRFGALAVYDWLGVIQDSLVRALW